MTDLTDIYGMIFGRNDDQGAPPADLTRDAPPTYHPTQAMPTPAWMNDPDMMSLMHRRGRVQPALERATRNAFLAGAHAPPTEVRRVGDVAPTSRAVAGTDINGQVSYDEQPRPLGDLYSEIGGLTGVRPGFLQDLARHESSEDPSARPLDPRTGEPLGAYGLMQFEPATWDSMVQQHGPEMGYPADLSPQQSQDMRADPRWSIGFGAVLSQRNAADMAGSLGRRPTEKEVYLGHMLGSGTASALLHESTNNRGSRPAANFVSREAARQNPTIFFDENGRPRSVNDVIRLQGRDFSDRPWGRAARTAVP